MVHVTAGIEPIRTTSRVSASGVVCIAFVAAVAGLALAADKFALAVYALSFWHYYLYALAYRYGLAAPPAFRRDAIVMKSVALALLGWAYAMSGFDAASLVVVAGGFALNALGAKALGAERTYYGCELLDLPHQRITQFPYSWTAHPMLLGNIAAYGGTLLNAEFRAHWWPLACAHVGLNLGLLIMEVAVEPLRLGTRVSAARLPAHELGVAAISLALGAAFGTAAARHADALVGAGLGACVACFAYGMYRFYTSSRPSRVAGNQPEETQ